MAGLAQANPRWRAALTAMLCAAAWMPSAQAVADDADEAARILQQTGVTGGLIVHLGCGDGRLIAALRADDGYLVHGLDTDPANIAGARAAIRERGVCGPVSVDTFDGRHLPYVDNLVNLLVAEDLGAVPMQEVMRVLAPNGVACVREGDRWETTTKPWPETIDEWTHWLHGPDNNAVAHDGVVAAPRGLQWVGGPLWCRSHEYPSSLCAMVSARGRLFYIFDEGPTGIIDKRIPDKWTLTARDAFSGVLLWKRRVTDWGWKAWKPQMEEVDWSRMQSQRTQLPLAIPRRLVAARDRLYVTLGYRAPLTVLDGATGRTIRTYEGTERTDEIVHEDGLLVLRLRASTTESEPSAGNGGSPGRETDRGVLVAMEADTGRRLWQTEPGIVAPLSLALSAPHVLYHDGDAVVCLDAASGKQRWRTPTGRVGHSIWNTDATLLVYEDVVLCANRKQVVGLSVANGKVLWKRPGAGGFGVANPPDLFVADGLVWYGQGHREANSITGYDPRTGRPARTVEFGPVITRGHHFRCYRSKATDNYLLLPKRAVEFISIGDGPHSRHNWVRGACRFGVLPCNGLLYSTPHPCFCYAGVKLNGFLALSPRSAAACGVDEAERLVRGPAYEALLKTGTRSPPAGPDDWTMYRHDPRRSGSTSTAVDPQVRPVWKAQPGGRLTQPVVVGRQVFVARRDAGQVCCLDAATGRTVWNYTAGGRIDSSPTCYRGRLIFGSADGWVTCLRASDGALAWRFRAAPRDRRVVAFNRVESAWPVHGSVLVKNNVAYVAAGRSSFLDGGIVLYGLDPVTGKKRYETRLAGPHPDTSVLDENAYAMEGAKSDILVTDGTLIYLFHNAFNERLEKQPTPIKGNPGVRNLGVRDFGEHLFSNAGFLDASGFSRSYWMLGSQWPAFNFAHQAPKAGQLLVFNETDAYAAKYFVRRNRLSPLFFPATDGCFMVADSRDTQAVLVRGDGKGGPAYIRWLPQTGPLQTCWNLGVGFARSKPAKWVNPLPVRVRAMVLTAGALFVAGPPDACDPDDPTGALEGRQGAILMALNLGDGTSLFQADLDTPPVFDGLTAARGRLYLATIDGSVLCLGQTK